MVSELEIEGDFVVDLKQENPNILELEAFYQVTDILFSIVKEHRNNSCSEGELLITVRAFLVDLQQKLEQIKVSIPDSFAVQLAKVTKISNELMSFNYTNFDEVDAREEFESLWENSPEIEVKAILNSFTKWICFAPIIHYTTYVRTKFVIESYSGEVQTENLLQEALLKRATDQCFEALNYSDPIDHYIARIWKAASAPSIYFIDNKSYIDQVLLEDFQKYIPINISYSGMTETIKQECNLNETKWTLLPTQLDCITNWELD